MLRALAVVACGTGLLLLLAGQAASTQQAFFAASPSQGGRKLNVARRVSHGGYSHARFRNELRDKTDDELHEIIALSRKKQMMHRFEVFRKKKPSAGSLYEWQYKIALSKTFLKQRELAKTAPEAEPLSEDHPERPTLTEWMRQNEDLDRAKREWAGVPGYNKVNYHPKLNWKKRLFKQFPGAAARAFPGKKSKSATPAVEQDMAEAAPAEGPETAAAEDAAPSAEAGGIAAEALSAREAPEQSLPGAFAGASGLILGLSAAALASGKRR